MPIKCECTGCGATLRVPDEMLGRKVRCPKCQMTFTAAEPESAPPPREEYRDEPPPPPRSKARDYDDEQPESKPSRSRSSNYDDDDPDAGSSRRGRRDDDEEPRSSRRRDEEDEPRSSRRRDDDEPPRSVRRRDDDYDDEPRSSRRRDDDDDDHDRGRSRSRRGGGGEKPGSVQTAGILMLIGGIVATLSGISVGLVFLSTLVCCLYPSYVYSIVVGIMAIIRGAALLGDNAYKAGSSKGIAIMLIINIVNFDLFSMTLGIVALVMLSNEESKRYFGE